MAPVRHSSTTRTRVTLRRARAHEVHALADLDAECFGLRAWPVRAWWEVVHEPMWTTLVAESHRGDLLAAAVLLPMPPVASLASIAVRPQWRRRGVGTALLAEMIRCARSASARWLCLEVDASHDEAIRLYRRMGFGVERRFLEDGLPRLQLVRRLRREGADARGLACAGRRQRPPGMISIP